MSHKWNLTARRKTEALKQLTEQVTVPALAAHFRISRQTLSKELKLAGIDPNIIRDNGKSNMKRMLYNSIFNIDDEAKRAQVAIQFLDKYPLREDKVEVADPAIVAAEISDKILAELNVQ